MATTAQTADFFGGGTLSARAAVKAPPKTNAQLLKEKADAKARAQSELTRKARETAQRNQAFHAQKATDAKRTRDFEARMKVEQSPEAEAWRAREKYIRSAGVDWGLIPMGAKVLATGAAVIASGGAVAGALGATAALGTAAAASTAATVINTGQKAIAAAKTGAKVASALQSGNVKQATSEALKGSGGVALIASKAGVALSQNDKDKLKGLAPKVKLPKSVTKTAKAATKAVKSTASAASAVKKAIAKTPAKAVTAMKSAATKAGTLAVKAAQKTVPLYPGSPVMVAAPKLVATASARANAMTKAVSQLKSGTMKSLGGSLTTKPKAAAPAKSATATAVSKAVATATKKTAPAPKVANAEEGYFIATSGPNKGKIDFQSRRWARAN